MTERLMFPAAFFMKITVKFLKIENLSVKPQGFAAPRTKLLKCSNFFFQQRFYDGLVIKARRYFTRILVSCATFWFV